LAHANLVLYEICVLAGDNLTIELNNMHFVKCQFDCLVKYTFWQVPILPVLLFTYYLAK